MDYTVLYIICIVAFVVGIVYGINFLRKRNLLNSEDIQFAIHTLSLTIAIIDELNLKNEPQIKDISSIVLSSLEYTTNVIKLTDIEEIKKSALNHALLICKKKGIEVTESRQVIIQELIGFTLYNKFLTK